MKPLLFLLLLLTVKSLVIGQPLPVLPSKPKPQPATQPKNSPAPKTKVIVKSNDRDGDGLTDAIDQCPDEKGPASNNGCPVIAQTSYASVTIGSQVWMQMNLDVEFFRNGDLIPNVKSNEEWKRYGEQGKPCWCYYNNDPENGKIYGKLYNWYAVKDPRGLAPKGWHIPSDAEWTRLSDYLGGENVAGGKLKSRSFWNSPNEGATNESGFTGLPGGVRYGDGTFDGIGAGVFWWSFTELNTGNALARYLIWYNANALRADDGKHLGYSVRCVRD